MNPVEHVVNPVEEERSITLETEEGREGTSKVAITSETMQNLLTVYRQIPCSVVRKLALYTLVMFTPIIVLMLLF